MTFSYFRGDGTRREGTTTLPLSRRPDFLKPENFRADAGLVDAVNVALLLGQPLLLTGEPGTGKTQVGHFIAWELGLGEALKYETKSGSTAGSLFYSYDALKRFQHIQSRMPADDALPYITYNALGQAILRTREPADVARYLPTGAAHSEPSRSVVIIDEVDKAPRDFPNDILNELDQLYFRVAELDNAPIRVNEALRPIVVLTSNSEKDLPDAFLRRCIFYHIPFPDSARMLEIVEARLGLVAGANNALLSDALDLFYALRATFRKQPSTAELLEWITALRDAGAMDTSAAGAPSAPVSLRSNAPVVFATLSTLVKTVEDQPKAKDIVREWAQGTQR